MPYLLTSTPPTSVEATVVAKIQNILAKKEKVYYLLYFSIKPRHVTYQFNVPHLARSNYDVKMTKLYD